MELCSRRTLTHLTLFSVVCLLAACRLDRPAAKPAAGTVQPAVEATRQGHTPTSESSATSQPPASRQPDNDGNAESGARVAVACDERRGDVFRQGLVGPAQTVLDGLAGASVYEIDVEISDDLLSLDGRERVCYTNREDEPLDEVIFRLFPNLLGGAATVSALRVDGQEVEPVYDLAGGDF